MTVIDKLKEMIKGHPDQTRQGVEKGGDFVDKRTQNKHSGQVDSAQQKINEQLGDRPPRDEQR